MVGIHCSGNGERSQQTHVGMYGGPQYPPSLSISYLIFTPLYNAIFDHNKLYSGVLIAYKKNYGKE